jgi:hypothetical protein
MAEPQTIDVRADTVLVPTSISLETTASVEDGCPIDCDVEDTAIWLRFGNENRALSLMLSDQALINLARVANKRSARCCTPVTSSTLTRTDGSRVGL